MANARAEAAPSKSIHARILGDIEGKILSGEWRPGHRIPFEHELSASYGCARMTVNKALSQLARAGLIERRRRVGSFVAKPPSRTPLLEIPEIRAEVEGLGLPYRFEILQRRRRPARRSDGAALEGLDEGPLLELLCLHWAGERPFCLEERLINLTEVPEAEGQSFARSIAGRLAAGARAVDQRGTSHPRPSGRRQSGAANGCGGGFAEPLSGAPHLERGRPGHLCAADLSRRKPRTGGALFARARLGEAADYAA